MAIGQVALQCDSPFGGYDCPECSNRGIIVYESGNEIACIRCACMDKRQLNKSVSASGLAGKIDEQTQESFIAEKAWQINMKKTSAKYLEEFDKRTRKWFYVGGNPGTGKTHLCTSIVGELLNRGFQAKYMIWREEVGRLKRLANDPEYDVIIREFKTVPVLYVDDFLKTAAGSTPTDADIQIGFEIINARYNNPASITILSSELRTEDVSRLDQGLGGRIVERAKPYVLSVYPGQDMRTGGTA